MAAHPVDIGPVGRLVAGRILAARHRLGITQRQLAARLVEGGHPIIASAISKLETGDRRIDVDDLCALAAALGLTPGDLLVEPRCKACGDTPPPGYACLACGAPTPPDGDSNEGSGNGG